MSNKKVYPVTIEALRKLITSKYYNASVEVDEKKRKPDNPDYWLWMLEQVPLGKNSIGRGIWLGRLLGLLQAFGIVSSKQAEDLILEDAWMGYV